jgi:hypothetical protein
MTIHEENHPSDDDVDRERSGEALAGLADDEVEHPHSTPPWAADLESDHSFGDDGRVNEAMAGIRQASDCWY